MIAILDKRKINKKELKDTSAYNIDNTITRSFNSIICLDKEELKIIKCRDLTLNKVTWEKEQLFRVLYHILKFEDKFDLEDSIIYLSKELNSKELEQLIRKLEKEGLNKS